MLIKNLIKIYSMENNNVELCSDCKAVSVYKNEDNLCNECSQYVDKYYCEECQLKHGCNKGLWESKSDKNATKLEKLLKKFTTDLILEVNEIIKELVQKNKNLEKKIAELEEN